MCLGGTQAMGKSLFNNINGRPPHLMGFGSLATLMVT